MKISVKTYFTCFFILLFFPASESLSAAETKDSGRKKIFFDFERRVKAGDSFQCFVKLERVMEYLLAVSGVEKKLEKYAIWVYFISSDIVDFLCTVVGSCRK